MIHLFISSYHNDTSWIRMPEAAVIEVGMAGRPENLAGTYSGKPGKYRKFRGGSRPRQDNKSIRNVLFDDRGDNISEENPYYGELTGLYWLWKHLDYPDSEIIGFCHYNKMLDISPGRVERLLRGISADWIAAVPDTIVPHSFPEDIRVLIRVLSEMEDQRYIDAWNRLYTGEGASAFRKGGSYAQLFYTTMREFRQYCSFLFQTLGEVRGIIGDVDRPPYHRRYCAFLGERLLSVYLEATGSRVKYAEIRKKGGWLLLWADRTTGFLKLHTGADLVYFAPDSVNTDTGKPSKRHVRNRQLVEDFLNHVQGSEERLRYRYWVPWSKLIRSDVVRKNRIRFDEIMYSNDIMFSVKTGYYAKTIAADSNVIYCVTEHAGSLTRNPTADVFCRRKEVECRCQLFLMERLTDENLKACGKTRFPNAAIDALRDGHGPGTLIRLAGIFAKYGLLWRF